MQKIWETTLRRKLCRDAGGRFCLCVRLTKTATDSRRGPQAQESRRAEHTMGVSLAILLLLVSFSREAAGQNGRSPSREFPPSRPNVLLILADDLGYSDPGCYGGEIETPHLDRLAAHGLRFTSFYNTARCWPTRASLLTGYYPQQIRRDALPTVPGGGAPKFQRPEWAPLLPHRLKAAGYRSYYSGKWHIDGSPTAGGFDRSYELQDQGRFFRPKNHQEDGKPLKPVAPGETYYSTIAIADHAIRCLRDHAESFSETPFFQYVAFTAPHFPLQALPEDIAKYADRYQSGWETIRNERWERIRQFQLVNCRLSPVERELGPPYAFPDQIRLLGPGEITVPAPWELLTDEQKGFQATKMAIHAAMVDRMDQEIGRILEQLKSMEAIENTLILFLSDNGASAEIMVRDDGHDVDSPPGSADTHLCLGPGWSTVCNTPFRRHKTWVHEGGTSTPLIASWPRGIRDAGRLRHTAGHVVDVVPTLLELAGVVPAAENQPDADAASPLSDSRVGPSLPGVSLVSALTTDQDDVFADSETTQKSRPIWWLHEGNRALRMGSWKIVAAKGDSWSLYNLNTDRSETRDVAADYPEILETLTSQWNRMTMEFTSLHTDED